VRRLVLAALVLALTGGAALAAAPERPRVLLPDLVQRPPSQLVVLPLDEDDGTTHYLLAFSSEVENLGLGPLIVRGVRSSTSVPDLTATQLIRVQGGPTRTRPVPLAIRYVSSPSHDHFHLLHFETYELRSADGSLVIPDHKTGFCLTDDYRSRAHALGRVPPQPVFTQLCGRDEPDALKVTEGITVGWGDRYLPILEGQSFDVTGLPSGDYTLVHRVNATHALAERSYANDVAATELSLQVPAAGGTPVLTVGRSCYAATCS
jgi:hypothetical protein